MSKEEKSPLAPAAALLFQAPQFQEPVNKEPEKREATKEVAEAAAQGQGSQTGRGGGRSGNKSSGKKKAGANKEAADAAPARSESQSETASNKKNGKKKSKPRETSSAASSVEQEKETESQASAPADQSNGDESDTDADSTTRRRRRRRPRNSSSVEAEAPTDPTDQVQALKGSTRLEAKRMRRREGRKEGRRRQSITEAEFLARRESVDREMVVRHQDGLDQIAVLEDGLLVEHYVARHTQQSIVGNIYLGRVQNVLPSMEAAFVDIGRGRNAVLYAGEVNWDSLGMEGKPRRIEQALKSGDTVLVQVTKDPIGHKGARLTSQVTLAGRYLVLVPGSSMLGISRKLPDTERGRLKKILREAVPEDAGVIVRTAAEGASEQQLQDDVNRLVKQWKDIQRKQAGTRKAPQLLRGEPELVVRVVRDIFNEDFTKLVVEGDETWETVESYVTELSPELAPRLEKWTSKEDVFHAKRIDQQLAKGMDRKVWLPSGGTLVIDRTEALTVVDVNTGKFIGSGGTLEETVTLNNLEAAEEIVRQLRLRDIGGIIIIDFVDMVLESNRELVLRRLVECLGRDRTRHQVTEITSLGLVQMTRKRVGEGLVEAFSTTCEVCDGRGFIVHDHPVEVQISTPQNGRKRKGKSDDQRSSLPQSNAKEIVDRPVSHVGDEKVKTALSAIAAATVATTKSADQPTEEDAPKQAALQAPSDTTPETAAEAPPAPRRRRAVSSQTSEPAVRAVEPTASEDDGAASAAGKPTLLDSTTAALDAAPQKSSVSTAPKTKRRRKAVAEAPVAGEKAASADGDAKRESAQQAVQDLLRS